MPSAGFFVISFVAVLLVFVPSVVFFNHGWRSSRASRAFSLLAFVVFVFFAWAAFTDPEASDFEAGAFILYFTWGVTLYLGVAFFLASSSSVASASGFEHGSQVIANPALNRAPFGRWTLRDKAAQRRLALR